MVWREYDPGATSPHVPARVSPRSFQVATGSWRNRRGDHWQLAYTLAVPVHRRAGTLMRKKLAAA